MNTSFQDEISTDMSLAEKECCKELFASDESIARASVLGGFQRLSEIFLIEKELKKDLNELLQNKVISVFQSLRKNGWVWSDLTHYAKPFGDPVKQINLMHEFGRSGEEGDMSYVSLAYRFYISGEKDLFTITDDLSKSGKQMAEEFEAAIEFHLSLSEPCAEQGRQDETHFSPSPG